MHKYILLFIIISFVSCQQGENKKDELTEVNSIIAKLQQKMLPDKRDQIFEIKAVEQKGMIVLQGATDFPELKKVILKTLQNNQISFVDSVRLLPDAIFKDKVALTRLSVANLRAKPKHAAELVTQTLMGMPLQIFEEKSDFYQVKTPEGYYAWVDAAGLIVLDYKDYQDWLKLPKIMITSGCGKVLSAPYTDAVPVSDYVLNDVFAFLQKQDDYTLVSYPDGRKGYIPNTDYMLLKFIADDIKNVNSHDIIEAAQQYMGIPYLWGGTSIKALDCSGFTKNVYAQFGYLLPRDASQQVKIGKSVPITDDFSKLQPGDLLFFGRLKPNGQEKITHVAIHLGNGRIIHATGEVKIESLNPKDDDYNEYRRKSLLQARRILGFYPQKLLAIYQTGLVKKKKVE